jgi:hypothetical protein
MQVRLIVPTVLNNPIARYGKAIAEIAGGFTATQAIGGWIDDNGALIVEDVTVFDCYADDELDIAKDDWRCLALLVAVELRQTSVYLSFDGKAEFIKSPLRKQTWQDIPSGGASLAD